MKKLLLSLLIVGSTSFIAVAYVQTKDVRQNIVQELVQQDDKIKVKKEDLPKVVQIAFQESDYESLKIESIFEVTNKEGKVYEFVLLNGVDKWAIRYSKEGKFIEEKKLSEG